MKTASPDGSTLLWRPRQYTPGAEAGHKGGRRAGLELRGGGLPVVPRPAVVDGDPAITVGDGQEVPVPAEQAAEDHRRVREAEQFLRAGQLPHLHAVVVPRHQAIAVVAEGGTVSGPEMAAQADDFAA